MYSVSLDFYVMGGNIMICLDPKELYEFFESKKLKYFYHANTVRTSCTFIEQNGLMSRGYVEYKGLTQTPQTSDEVDKKFDVWNDIFWIYLICMDTFHEKICMVLFVLL